MAQSQIKWKKGDYISLGKAVAEFNKKINKLQKEEDLAYLPAKIDYKEARENIKKVANISKEEIFKMLSEGKTKKEIANFYGIDKKTLNRILITS